MCDMMEPIDFSFGPIDYHMQWRLVQDNPARYELVVSCGLPGEEKVEKGTVTLTGFLLNAYEGNRKLREELADIVKKAVQAGEFAQD